MSQQQSEVIAQAIPATPEALAPSRPQASPSIRVSPGIMTLIVAPVTVATTMLLGCGLLSLANMPIHPLEMVVGAIVTVVGGHLAGVVMLVMMNRGTTGVAQGALLGIGLRCGTVLMGILLACYSGFPVDRMILAYWAIAYYMPMLVTESMLVAWLSNHLPAGPAGT